ncbi:MAG: aminomethyl-transferring glycine dehydrogenase subunit GcvPB [Thermoplasmataceae archaeon]
MNFHQATYDERLLNEFKSGSTYKIPGDGSDAQKLIPVEMQRNTLKIPGVAEYDAVRHFTRLSQMNYSVDLGIYPLGSCTMKYNPKYADKITSLEQYSEMHPLQPEYSIQGSLRIMYELQEYLKKIADMDAVTLQPLAGAHGEFTGILIVRKYLEDTGQLDKRNEIIVPDSAHGTNPASAAMGGFNVVEVPSDSTGMVDVNALKAALSERTAAFMITNPSTLGMFERDIVEISKLVHDAGALLYYDGANFNAILGITSPGIMGFDIVHFNLHKTFATPHGGGGPGAGPVAVKKKLEKYLPVPRIGFDGSKYFEDYSSEKTIGRISPYFGAFAVLLRAWAYITYQGSDGLEKSSRKAVLNTNYITKRLSKHLSDPYGGIKKHEVVLSSANTPERALDIAKYLIDNGVHAPTVYFPLIVKEALMIEPTESVNKDDLDTFCDAVIGALKAGHDDLLHRPKNLSVGRIDEIKAAKDQVLTWSLQK